MKCPPPKWKVLPLNKKVISPTHQGKDIVSMSIIKYNSLMYFGPYKIGIMIIHMFHSFHPCALWTLKTWEEENFPTTKGTKAH
jgi:hypothetical protein